MDASADYTAEDLTGQIEVDENANYNDAASATSSLKTQTTSVTASVYDYQFEHGRRYHAFRAGKYLLPNDEKEQERLNLQHHLWMLVLQDKLYLAPLEKAPHRVLDIGTGTGIWAIDLGNMYPEARVIGTDLSPIQPTWTPRNVRFEIDDSEEPWTYTTPFDFIHCRTMFGSIRNWDNLFTQAYDNLNVGGYFELQEFDAGIFCDDESYDCLGDGGAATYFKEIRNAMDIIGTEMECAWEDVPKRLEKAGFQNAQLRQFKVPCSPWAKAADKREQGTIMRDSFSSALEAYGLAMFIRVLDMAEDAAMDLIKRAYEDIANPHHHIYMRAYVIYGKKT